jgi:hypothetical protein
VYSVVPMLVARQVTIESEAVSSDRDYKVAIYHFLLGSVLLGSVVMVILSL